MYNARKPTAQYFNHEPRNHHETLTEFRFVYNNFNPEKVFNVRHSSHQKFQHVMNADYIYE